MVHINWRRASRFSVITLAILVVIIILLFQRNTIHTNGETNSNGSVPASSNSQTSSISASNLQGIDLGQKAAPDFQLTDQYGKQISLEQFKGKPVVLLFLNTSCSANCSHGVDNLHSSLQQLGNDTQNIAVLAISTDAIRDTSTKALQFSEAHHMQNDWHYLIGQQNTLASVWSNYGIKQSTSQTSSTQIMVYMIDKQGRERVALDNNFTSDQITTNLQQLFKEPA
jgi:protein SCO1